jgi:cytochrome c peroxidase
MSSEPESLTIPAKFGIPLMALGLALVVGLNLDFGKDDRSLARAKREALIFAMSPVPEVPPAQGNAKADDEKVAIFGQALFFDKGFSSNGVVSCATCHKPELSFTDGLRVAVGVGSTKRNTPSLLGAQFNRWWFWDGRADSQWAQALGPIEDAAEHDFDRLAVALHVVQSHPQRYQDSFESLPDYTLFEGLPEHASPNGDGEAQKAWTAMSDAQRDAVNRIFVHVGKALEAYQRLLLPGEAPIDRYVTARKSGDLKGGGHLSPSAVRGLQLFIGKAECVLCHSGALFTDNSFHTLGLPSALILRPCKDDHCGPDSGRSFGAAEALASEMRCGSQASDEKDCRRLRHLNPKFEDFMGAFKTPSLRQVSQTAPYMHTGELASLGDVLGFYNELPGNVTMGHRELFLEALRFKPRELSDLQAFLESLSGAGPAASLRQPVERE